MVWASTVSLHMPEAGLTSEVVISAPSVGEGPGAAPAAADVVGIHTGGGWCHRIAGPQHKANGE